MESQDWEEYISTRPAWRRGSQSPPHFTPSPRTPPAPSLQAWNHDPNLRPAHHTYVPDQHSTQSMSRANDSNEWVQMDEIKHGLQKCEDTHAHCTPTYHTVLPGLRVIDCNRICVMPAPNSCSYVALSYVWGNAVRYEDSMADISANDLPRTIQDSIQVTRLLGFDYLWIDRYCIDQENEQEQQQQIQQMAAIYSSAQVTIIAVAGIDPSFGLPGISRARSETTDHVITLINQSVWVSRAWTFQEGFFSKRRLFFTETEVLHICNEKAYGERGWAPSLDQLRDQSNFLPRREGRNFDVWSLIHEYTKRDLTHDKDALDAIAGALNTFQTKVPPMWHIWGVPFCPDPLYMYRPPLENSTPSRSMAIGIFWRHTLPCYRREGFPSWSALGWKGKVQLRDSLSHLHETAVEISVNKIYQDLGTVALETSGLQDLSSTEESKVLRITARTFPYRKQYFVKDPNKKSPTNGFSGDKLCIQVNIDQDMDIFLEPDWDVVHDQAGDVRHGICVFITHKDQLVLLVLDEHGGYYERSGIFSTWDLYRRKTHFQKSDASSQNWRTPEEDMREHIRREAKLPAHRAVVVHKNSHYPILGIPDFRERVVPALLRVAEKKTFLLR